ncbi:helix-turn-helix transcriptional regulator [Turicibacter sanguinis]|uniref:helix-turn-helix transcriptional regulator n=1 Tax=Turicibacter sanguinis TaxID=154288 RepID=UPI0018ABBB04|nr:helix-turn-helix transcriptional regulator [Turicibacter sanguinis]
MNIINRPYKLKELRARYNYTQQEVADVIGITRQYYSRLEKNESFLMKASLEIILALCKLFQVTINYFIEEYI